MNQGSYQRLMESLIRCNEQLFDLATKQAQPTTQALLQMQMQDLTSALQKGLDDPSDLLTQQANWWQSQLQLFQNAMLKQAGQDVSPVVEPERGDRRFRDSQWQEHPWYDYIKQSYLLTARQMLEHVERIPDLSDGERDRLRFFTRQMVNALAPSNFLASNPELLKLTMESGGNNLLDGLKLLTQDIQRSAGTLNVRMTDESAFQLGQDLATTEGEVIHQAPLFELIQYRPTTDTVAKRPLLIVPPFVNKYYILDLRPENSLVKYLVDQGHTVMMISWANPDQRHIEVDFEDYVVDGVLAALEAVEAATGEREVNAAGYCIGGTLLACTMAYMAGRRMKQRVKSATFFTTILDFSQPGELGAFINDEIVSALEAQNAENGLMDGRQLAVTFSMLRENNLYWNYYIDGYLKGQSPMAFDLLHWNCDSTNVAGPTHSTMLRKFYLENRLIEAGEYSVRGTKIDLKKITVPSYFVSTVDDHIALWQGTYLGLQRLGGEPTFVLGESGHIAGIINPPGGKYGHYVGGLADQPEAWMEQAAHQEGSWWPHWMDWLAARPGSEAIPARQINDPIGPAPGDYVQVRLNPTFDEGGS
ncbi:class I poly(R)-hydroxyalkanoic acid synthase [Marinobacter hydrocarbonoclasticus]|nr:class I poly(R)-hydroxyalkanoic acid synthase [Marinobacter nauticus]